MADDLIQKENPEEQEEGFQEQTRDEDFSTDGMVMSDPQDSLAINRARAAYGKKAGNSGLRERRTPQRVVTSDYVQEEPYEPDDIDDDTIIAPEKAVINKTYKSSLDLRDQKTFTPIAESSGGSDVLALQTADGKSGQTISFKVKGIQWKAGFANEFNKTPLGHTMHPIPLPHPNDERPDSLKKTGIVIRPVNPKLQKVLNQLLPSSFKKEMGKERGKRERLKQLSIFYLPSAQSSSVGFIHEFIVPRSDGKNAFYLYIQTSVGKAPVAILDEVLKTLEAGLPEGEKADVYDYTEVEEQDVILPEPNYKLAEEVNEAMKQVSNTLNDSIVVHSVKQGAANMKNMSTDLMRNFDKYLARVIRVLAAVILILMNSMPIRLFVQGLRIITKGMVKLIWGVNKLLLGIARSPVTTKIMGVFGKTFSLFGGVFGAVLSGLAYFFRMIGRAFVITYKGTAELFKNPIKLDLGISFPGKQVSFEVDEKTGQKRKKSSIKIKGAKKVNLVKPAEKQNSSNVAVSRQGKFSQVTKPASVSLKKPDAPKIKGLASNLPSISGSGIVRDSNNSSVSDSTRTNNQNNKIPGNSPLGYFEDEPF